MNRVLQDIQILSSNEKNDLMKILIASMDENHDNDSDKFWADIAKNRFTEKEIFGKLSEEKRTDV